MDTEDQLKLDIVWLAICKKINPLPMLVKAIMKVNAYEKTRYIILSISKKPKRKTMSLQCSK